MTTFAAPPQHVAAWHKGARGEQRVGARLDKLADHGMFVLHDRRVPRSEGNIDHIVVSRAGVWIVDTKAWNGALRIRSVGPHRERHLFVEGHDRTKAVTGLARQVGAVTRILGGDVPTHPVLCFTGADWPLLSKPSWIDEVLITWPRALTKAIVATTSCDIDARDVTRTLLAALPAR